MEYHTIKTCKRLEMHFNKTACPRKERTMTGWMMSLKTVLVDSWLRSMEKGSIDVPFDIT